MGDNKDDDNKKSSKAAFNNAGMRVYGAVSGVTMSVCLAVFSAGMAMKPDSSSLWTVAALLGVAGVAGGILQTVRYIKESNEAFNADDYKDLKSGYDDDDDDDDWGYKDNDKPDLKP